MNILQSRKDDFADVAADPVRRQAAIERLTKSHRRLEWSGLGFLLLALLQAFDHSWGAVGTGLFTVILMVAAGQMRADLHLLQVTSKFYDKPSA